MQINKITLALSLVISPLCASGAVLTQAIPAASLAMLAGQENGTLLKTITLSANSTQALSEPLLTLNNDMALWDTGRGIFQTHIPGIGFSLCNHDGDRCVTRQTQWVQGTPLTLRIYKTGDVKGGKYTFPALNIAGAHKTLLRIAPLALTIKTALCSISAKRVSVTFPEVTASEQGKKLTSMNFAIPVTCQNPDDYNNVGIQFRYGGVLVDNYTLPTQLKNVGIQITGSDNTQVEFNTTNVIHYPSFNFSASLISLPGTVQEYGKFSVDATALVTLR